MNPTPAHVTTHELRTWPAYFQQTWLGRKTFDVRYDDRGFQRGDRLVLREWDPRWPCTCEKGHDAACAKYTGREIHAEIGYVLASTPSRGNTRGFSGNGYVVLAVCQPQNYDVPPTLAVTAAAAAALMAGAQR
jgi:hypothetical protein